MLKRKLSPEEKARKEIIQRICGDPRKRSIRRLKVWLIKAVAFVAFFVWVIFSVDTGFAALEWLGIERPYSGFYSWWHSWLVNGVSMAMMLGVPWLLYHVPAIRRGCDSFEQWMGDDRF